MRTEEEVRAAWKHFAQVIESAQSGQMEPECIPGAVLSGPLMEAMEWVLGAENNFAEMLKQLDGVDKARDRVERG